MILLDKLGGATTSGDLRDVLSKQCRQWGVRQTIYLLYDEARQILRSPNGEIEASLTSGTQAGQCALTLRPCRDQGLAWPEIETAATSFRMGLPVLHWGSLIAVLLLEFEKEPSAETLERVNETVEVLGVIGHGILLREKTAEFVLRTQELLVHAVEAQGAPGHVGRCSRVATALATLLDCSAQAKSELLEATQYHDVGLLAFSEPRSAAAMREHAQRGARLLECHPELADLAPLVEAHHERYDGSGVPRGRRGDELPLEAWILALTEDLVESWEATEGEFSDRVCDFFHQSAKHHHPDVVDALCGLVDSGKLKNLLEG